MTRRDFQFLADLIRSHDTDPAHCRSCEVNHDRMVLMAQDIVIHCKEVNPRFKADRFFRACGLPELADN